MERADRPRILSLQFQTFFFSLILLFILRWPRGNIVSHNNGPQNPKLLVPNPFSMTGINSSFKTILLNSKREHQRGNFRTCEEFTFNKGIYEGESSDPSQREFCRAHQLCPNLHETWREGDPCMSHLLVAPATQHLITQVSGALSYTSWLSHTEDLEK